MIKSRDHIFVLWGNEFEEAVAAIFVSELREAGLRVKVVGLNPPRIRGAHGLALVPDLTLDQALPLVSSALYLIIPYASPGLKRFENDPRLLDFFEQARANRACFVIGPSSGAEPTHLEFLSSLAPDQIVLFPQGGDIVTFARDLASSLQPD